MSAPEPRTTTRFWSVGAFIVLGVALALRLAYWAYAGTRVSPDGVSYLGTCGLMWHDFLGTMRGFIGLEYVGFLVPFCAFLAVPGAGVDGWVAVQILMSSLGAVLVYDAARTMYGSTAGLVAGLGMALLWETAQWDVYILSESTFFLALATALWTLARRIALPSSRGRTWAAYGALLWLAFTRPIGLPILLGYGLWDLLPRRNPMRVGLAPRPIHAAVVVLAAILLVSVVSDRSAWAEGAVGEVYRDGLLVHDDPTFRYDYEPRPADSFGGFVSANLGAVFVMALGKAALFFLPFTGRFSFVHNAMNAVTLLPVLVLGLWGAVCAWQRRDRFLAVWVTPLVVAVAVAAATFIDYDWRYRVPATPALAIGGASLFIAGSRADLWCRAAARRVLGAKPAVTS